MRIVKTLTGLATFAFMTTSAIGQEKKLEPYVCPEPSNQSITESWMKSESRQFHYNSGGSLARQKRGKTYGAFLDAFWSDLDVRFTQNPPKNTSELFDGIGASYEHAYKKRASASLAHGVTPQLFLDTAFRNRTPSGDLNDNDIVLTPKDLNGTTLSQNPDLQKLLPFDGGALDNGIEISIRFMPKWGDYLHAPIASGLGEHVDMNNETPLENLLGSTNPDYPGYSYKKKVNIKDSVICPKVM